MTESSLRDALEKLHDRLYATGTRGGKAIALQLDAILNEHPAEPVGVSDEARAAGLIDCGGAGHEFEAEVADCRTCGSSGVSDEARAAGLKALLVDNGWHKSDGTGVWRANYKRAVDLVLEAAQPFMQPQVVASQLDRETAYLALLETWNDMSWDEHDWKVPEMVGQFANAVTALVRPLPTREQIAEWLSDHDIVWREHPKDSLAARVQQCQCGWMPDSWQTDDEFEEYHREHRSAAVLALMGGTEEETK